MVHPAIVGGIVAGVAIAAILGYMYIEEHFSHETFAVPVSSATEDIDLDESSCEEGDDDTLDWLAKRSGLRRRKTRRKAPAQFPDETAIQEKYSHVVAMEQAMERRRRALEEERLEIERQEQEIAYRRSLISSYVPPPSVTATASTSVSPAAVSPASASPPVSVTVSIAASEDQLDDVWSVAAASTVPSVREPASTPVEKVVAFDEEATTGNRVVGPRSTDSWEDLDQTMSNASTE